MSSPRIRTTLALTASAALQVAFAAGAAASQAQDASGHADPATQAPVSTRATSATATHAAPAAAASSGTETGLAAVYSDRLDGHRTASGKRYHRNALTTAHKTLAFGTRIRVTNTKNHRSVEAVVTDRGPKQANRILDVSVAAAKKLGISRHGMAEVTVEVVGETHR